MNVIKEYLEQIQNTLNTIAKQEQQSLEKAADVIADAYVSGHEIYVFGCTHSAILAEDVFYRAGAPAFWRPLWGPGMSIATTPGFLTSAMEHSEEVGNAIVDCSQMGEGDVLLVISTSGKNAAPVAVAEGALKRGVKLLIITSSSYKDLKGNHSRIPNLWHFANEAVIMDNHIPQGDTSIQVGPYPMGPMSTAVGSFLMHTLSALAIGKIDGKGVFAPVFMSSNAPGGLEHNLKLLSIDKVKNAFMLP